MAILARLFLGFIIRHHEREPSHQNFTEIPVMTVNLSVTHYNYSCTGEVLCSKHTKQVGVLTNAGYDCHRLRIN